MASEKKKFAKSILFLGISSLKLFIHMLIDYCLYWILATIQRHGRVQIAVEGWSVFCSVSINHLQSSGKAHHLTLFNTAQKFYNNMHI
jgi:hypothetical protein